MNWTDERVEKLKRLWADGLSASQIAAQLGGVSRNAVIGKVHRLNLPGRAKAGGATQAASRPQARNTSAPRAPNFAARATTASATRTVTRPVGATVVKEEIEIEVTQQPEFEAPANVVVPMSRRLSLTDLTERTCKWPMGDPLKDDFHFCGAESGESSPYCRYHARLAYQPVNERRKAASMAAAARA
ncbi:GcrA cell cycle regulator [Rhizobium sp. RU35A]|uniref:GcrA cell cycle regulator n=1 Tax=Rhizobium straminoryzae TaxID=1387186 RepID=A0A549T013_9HYPH|nr:MULTISPECIES: GcrA family cell cycle regulator [Rhizobium]TRL35223.1 GcrA cell cycle regulator [Rhizobium straminoryzae]SIQ03967.1 GcrA cell cycle regulator [Rhizobium sp. RU35A]